jgi:DNA-binding response OmpR family regulator
MPKKILVIEDDFMLNKIVEARLQKAGYEVVHAEDGLKGLKLARTIKPDLIVMDIMLPKMDGFRVTQMLKLDDHYKHIPIIIFTGRMQQNDEEVGLEAGADAYIYKTSGEPSDLVDKIEELIGEA